MSEAPRSNRADHWVERRLSVWQEIDERLPALEDRRPVPAETALDLVRHYPEIARDLAIAKNQAPAGRVAAYLEHTYARLHRVLFRQPRPPASEQLAAFREELPAAVAELRWHLTVVTLGFVLCVAAGWWLVATFPELISLFASEQMIDTVHRGELWTDHLLNVTPSSVLSIGIFTNNIAVALTTMCLGLLYGLGTIYIIGLNGLMLGGVFAFVAREGLGMRLFEFVCAHGFVELTIICIAGAMGLYAGEALARPGHLTRTHALQKRFARISGLLALCVIFLVGAGLIEGYISPSSSFPLAVRLTIGLAYFALLLFALAGFRLPGGPGRVEHSAAPSDPAL